MQANRLALSDALKRAVKVVRWPGIPALTGVLIESNELGLRLTTTDLETSYRATVETVDGEQWTALPPAKALRDALGKIKDESVGLEYDSEGQRLTVVRDNGARISFRTLVVEDFPTITPAEGIAVRIEADDFRRVFGTVLPFASSDQARPTLTGILLEYRNGGRAGLTVVATDSFRLAVAREYGALATAEFGNVIIPSRTVKETMAELGKGPGTVILTISVPESNQTATRATFELPSGAQWSTQTIYGQFPNWQQLIPDQFDGTITWDLPEALEAVTTAGLVVEDNVPMRLELNGSVRITASSPDAGTFEQDLTASTYAGEIMTVAYSPAYFRECLVAVDGAPMRLRDAPKPAVFGDLEQDGRAVLLMPVRIPAPIG